MLRRHGRGRLTYLLPVALGALSFFPWAGAAFVTAALLSRGDSFAFVDKGSCTFSPSTATLCSFALYNGGDRDVILDSNTVTLSFFYSGAELRLQRKINGDSKTWLESDVLKKSLLVIGKGKTEILDLSPSGSDWQAWAQKAGTASISAYLSVSYAVQGDSTLNWKTIYSPQWNFTVAAQ